MNLAEAIEYQLVLDLIEDRSSKQRLAAPERGTVPFCSEDSVKWGQSPAVLRWFPSLHPTMRPSATGLTNIAWRSTGDEDPARYDVVLDFVAKPHPPAALAAEFPPSSPGP